MVPPNQRRIRGQQHLFWGWHRLAWWRQSHDSEPTDTEQNRPVSPSLSTASLSPRHSIETHLHNPPRHSLVSLSPRHSIKTHLHCHSLFYHPSHSFSHHLTPVTIYHLSLCVSLCSPFIFFLMISLCVSLCLPSIIRLSIHQPVSPLPRAGVSLFR